MPTRVFISYAHDDQVHQNRVRDFWLFLRAQGIDANADLTAAGQRQDWAEWMTRQVRDADRVLVIASPEYKRRAEGDAAADEGRGLQWEARLIRDLFYANQRTRLQRVLPVVLPGCSADDIPLWLAPAAATHYAVRDYTVPGAESLLRLLTGQPLEIAPPLGQVPSLPPRGIERSAAWPGEEIFTELHAGAAEVVPAVISESMHQAGPAAEATASGVAMRWVHGGTLAEHFSGRSEELGRLKRWAEDTNVRVIGITAWGGAGKTTLVTEFIERHHAATIRPFKGMFAWSFYEDPEVEHWGRTLLSWINTTFDIRSQKAELPVQILDVIGRLPLLLVLDGLEVIQEGPAQSDFGRLLDGILRATLIGLCLTDHGGLVLLTSRFPFADLEHFDGAQARMLDVPPLTPQEGADLLKHRGANWLGENERMELVSLVDGHALAVNVLSAVLRDRLPTADLVLLHEELRSANRTDERVTKVLNFYANRLSEADRILVSIVSLFQQPVEVRTILSLGSHDYLGHVLAGRGSEDVEVACRQRLAGLVTWHSGGLVSAHPLVRDVFRSFILSERTAQLASDVTLGNLPSGPVSSPAEAQRIVEVIELLLDSSQYNAARSLYTARTRNGRVWMRLPAARLGQRCAIAFLQSQLRDGWLSEQDIGFFSNETGLFAMHTGDVARAEKYLRDAAECYRSVGAYDAEAVTLRNLARCLAYHGRTIEAQKVASKALDVALKINNNDRIRNARTSLAWVADKNGDLERSTLEFELAGRIQAASDGRKLYSVDGTWLADFLVRIGKVALARSVTIENLRICESQGWNADIGRCSRVLGRCDIAGRKLDAASANLERAIAVFRDGDYLLEMADTLPDVAECHRLSGDLDEGERICTEVIIALAGPRELIPALAAALSVRGLIRTDRYAAGREPLDLERARDDANHCFRLATKVGHLPWLELSALEVYSAIEAASGSGYEWHSRLHGQYKRLGARPRCTETATNRCCGWESGSTEDEGDSGSAESRQARRRPRWRQHTDTRRV